MYETKLIKSAEQHKQALSEFDKLMDQKPKNNTPEADRLELLSILISHYEKKAYPIKAPNPIDAILFRMEQMNLTRKDLEPYIGHSGRVSEILSGKRKLTLAMIRKLHKGLKIPAELLISEYKHAPAMGSNQPFFPINIEVSPFIQSDYS